MSLDKIRRLVIENANRSHFQLEPILFFLKTRANIASAVAVASLWLTPFSGHAQPAPPSGVTPPELRQAVEPVYPEAAFQERREGVVGLRLTIDAEGRVTQAEVIESAGSDLDEAARAVAFAFRFKPAERDGHAIAARVLRRIELRLPPEPPPAEERAAEPTPLEESRRAAPPPSAPLAAPADLTPIPAPPPAEPIEVTVQGTTAADRLRHSAEAVTVVDTKQAKQQSADLGEVLARTQGVNVRRDAGLGSNARFYLNGLTDDQIRFFLDGIPLSVAGFPFTISDIPVNLVERVEIYRGVVPIRFGADALGGAVNLVTEAPPGSHAGASYQIGSFGTHRLTASARHQDDEHGWFFGGSAFLDLAKNDYPVDVQAADALGHLRDVTVRRFHDGYRAFGALAEGGVLNRPWAERLSLRAGYTGYDKDLQSNVVMKVPYGEVTYAERVFTASARYDQALASKLRLETVAGYARREITFQDKSNWVYDWFGNRTLERHVPGEISNRAYDQIFWQDDVYARALVAWSLGPWSTLRFSSALGYSGRTGKDYTLTDGATRDPLAPRATRVTLVSGGEWELDGLHDRLQNVAFVKDYSFHAAFDEALPGGRLVPLSRASNTLGAGDEFRIQPVPGLYLKASYEYATRLPNADELFGNGVLIGPNPDLVPEISHNANMGPRLEVRDTPAGDLTVDIDGFWRDSDHLLVLLGGNQFLLYQNVTHARSLGIEGDLAWTSPGRWLTLESSSTYTDLRNVSNQGTFGAYDGDRIPNRPWLTAAFGTRGRIARLPARVSGALEPFYIGRYVHSFLRGWESVGLPQFKERVSAQLSHDLGVTYSVHVAPTLLHMSFEVDNALDSKLYDSFGAQRPGRAYNLKFVAEI